ncbi:MAG: BBP7 family outer membrane beta-barrel protein [Gemmataceae bacterium]|nr:BBP7 family outer membrane beta-barrel protein [Gemmataceae bacterium]
MKRRVSASLAILAAGAGLAVGQVRPGSVLVTEDPTPPRSVIRSDGSPAAPRPAPVSPRPPAIKPVAATQTPPPETPPPAPVRVPADPGNKPSVPASGTNVIEPPVAESRSAIPAIVAQDTSPVVAPEPGSAAHGYSSRLMEPVFPWTKCGRRTCGTVYIDTPYIWLDTQMTYSWINTATSVPLVTAGAPNAAVPGALGDPGTTVLVDGQNLTENPFYGGRFLLGGWFDECQYFGAEGGYFFLGARERGFIASANGNPGLDGLFIPYFNPNTGIEDAMAVATGPPNQASGWVQVTSRTRVQGAEGHFLFSFARGLNFRTDALMGVRWLGLDEDLIIEQTINQQPLNQILVPTTTNITDVFSTRSDFIGLDLGFKSHWQRNCWSMDVVTRIALGGTHQTIRNNAGTTLTAPGFFADTPGFGRLITATNIGEFTKDVFSVVPEIGATLAYQPTSWCRFNVGYNWTYWTNVIRAGDQVDHVVNPNGVASLPQFNPTQIEPRRPAIIFNQSDLWIQSVSLGVQFMY